MESLELFVFKKNVFFITIMNPKLKKKKLLAHFVVSQWQWQRSNTKKGQVSKGPIFDSLHAFNWSKESKK